MFNPVPFLPPSDECLHQIFSRSVLLWLQQFPESAVGDAEVLAEVSLTPTDTQSDVTLTQFDTQSDVTLTQFDTQSDVRSKT